MPPAFWERYALALLVTGSVLAVLYAIGVRLTHRRNAARCGNARAIAVEETVAVAPGAYVALLRVAERRLLIGVTSRSVTLLGEDS